jgi:hypothetical protein
VPRRGCAAPIAFFVVPGAIDDPAETIALDLQQVDGPRRKEDALAGVTRRPVVVLPFDISAIASGGDDNSREARTFSKVPIPPS